jgi:hypothetical protein
MRDYWLVKYVLSAIGLGYVILTVIAIGLALWLAKTRKSKINAALVVLAIAAILPIRGIQEYRQQQQAADAFQERYDKAEALFDERCKTAGERIYRTVEDVEGILLVNPRLKRGSGERADRDWIGAGFPHESGGNQYIMEFLYFNEPASGNRARGLGWIRKGLQGYPYVDIEEQGVHFRYRLVAESEYKNLSDPVKDYGSQEIVTTDYPRYAVTYDNIADPEGRANWVAGGRVTVVDRATKELLGEFIRYAFEPGLGNTGGERSPWGFAQLCPVSTYGGGPGHIRSFVEQVLKPKQGNNHG